MSFAICVAAHVVLVQIVGSPWWVPNLTLVGLVLSVAAFPSRWFWLSAIAGWVMMLWTIRYSGLVMATFLVVGWVVRVLARHWDVTNVHVQRWVVGGASVVIAGGALWSEQLWSLWLLGALCVHVVLTIAAVSLLRVMQPKYAKGAA